MDDNFFKRAESGSVFQDNEEYLEEAFFWANYCLLMYIEMLGNQSEESDANQLYPNLESAAKTCMRNVELGREETRSEIPSPSDMMRFIQNRARASDESGIRLPLCRLEAGVELRPLTVFCLVLGLLALQQSEYAKVFQVLNQNELSAFPTVETAAKIFFLETFLSPDRCREVFLCMGQLRRLISINKGENRPLSAEISLDGRMAAFLLGDEEKLCGDGAERFFRYVCGEAGRRSVLANEPVFQGICDAYEEGKRLFFLWGDEGSGRRFFTGLFCQKYHMSCLEVDCERLRRYDQPFVEEVLWQAARECVLSESCCCLRGLRYQEEGERLSEFFYLVCDLIGRAGILLFCLSEEEPPPDCRPENYSFCARLPAPKPAERKIIWERETEGFDLDEDVNLEELAALYIFTPGKIREAVAEGRRIAKKEGGRVIGKRCLARACSLQMGQGIAGKAVKVSVRYSWNDLVMDENLKETLKQVCRRVRYRDRVLRQWNYETKFPGDRGTSVLLYGPPGTGKTMCAQVIAYELGLDLYRVDLSRVMDKYIGETEKGISKIFEEAKKCSVVLLFDEADTLFGKRTDEGGPGEAANNNKTAQLLQEIEDYDGVTVLATNFKHNIDPAFFRRMKFIVEFPFPDAAVRYRLWRSFAPENAPVSREVDYRFLADRFELAGGNIKNCALNAAFFAADDGEGEEIGMKHYLKAVKHELVKTGKLFAKTDFGPYGDLLDF